MKQVYLRNQDGTTFHTDFSDGLKQFLDPEKGYRITIYGDNGEEVTLRRDTDPSVSYKLDTYLDQTSLEVVATIRGMA